jgi:hypothetical protein
MFAPDSFSRAVLPHSFSPTNFSQIIFLFISKRSKTFNVSVENSIFLHNCMMKKQCSTEQGVHSTEKQFLYIVLPERKRITLPSLKVNTAYSYKQSPKTRLPIFQK